MRPVKALLGLSCAVVMATAMFPIRAADASDALCVCQIGAGPCTEETFEWAGDPDESLMPVLCGTKCRSGSDGFRYSANTLDTAAVAAARQGCPAAPPASTGLTQDMTVGGHQITFVKPTLSFDIPGLTFSDVLQRGNQLEVGFIADYITAAYRLLLGISVTVAIVMVMVGGIQYVLGAGTGDVKAAKERIANAVTGLVLMLSVYVILFTINPQLTLLPALQIELVEEIPIEREDDTVVGSLATDFKVPVGSNIGGDGAATVPIDLTASIEAVAKKLDGEDIGISIASSFRSVARQVEQIKQNCENPPGSATCNPKPGRPQTCILKDMDPAKCPHTTGRALDIWATKKTSEGVPVQCVSQETCLQNMRGCFNDPCQKALIDAMKAEGFCVLSSEAWHFEKPRMSSNCR